MAPSWITTFDDGEGLDSKWGVQERNLNLEFVHPLYTLLSVSHFFKLVYGQTIIIIN